MGLMLVVGIATLGHALPQEPPAVPIKLLPEVVLSDASDPVPLAAFGLGDGGVGPGTRQGFVTPLADGCVTPGGVRVEARSVGVKLSFPGGRELLLAPDGHLHLRSGGVAGPFPAGLELLLGDGSSVRIHLEQAQRARLRDVVVVRGDRAMQIWRRGRPSNETPRVGLWNGVRVCCCGDGGDLYRAIAIGPLVTLERLLVPGGRERETPAARLVVLAHSLKWALKEIPRQSRGPDPELRSAVRAVIATAERGDLILPDGAALRRADHDSLRWVLRGGYELELALDGPRAPRLSLFVGRAARPMVEWVLGAAPAAFLGNPRVDQPGAPRWYGNGVRMPTVVPELQARRDLFEHGRAIGVIRSLLR